MGARAVGCRLEIVSRAVRQRGLGILPRRWVVERTLGGLGRQRRWSKDYGRAAGEQRDWVQIALSRLMLRPMTQKPAF